MIVDAHLHVYRRADVSPLPCLPGQLGVTGACEVLTMLDQAGVDQAVIMGYPSPEFASYFEQNRFVLGIAQAGCGRLHALALLDDDIGRWIDAGCVGAKEHVYGMRRKIWDDANVVQYRILEATSRPLLIHCPKNAVDRVRRILDVAPSLRIVLAHIGWHYEYGARPTEADIEPILRGIEGLPRVYVDTAAYRRDEAGLVRMAVDALGVARVMWGSDWPTDLAPYTIQFDNSADLGTGYL